MEKFHKTQVRAPVVLRVQNYRVKLTNVCEFIFVSLFILATNREELMMKIILKKPAFLHPQPMFFKRIIYVFHNFYAMQQAT